MAEKNEDASLSGHRIAHYEIAEQIGAGGMGQVYRAKDTKLGRHVAIKVLPVVFTQDPSRRGRFEQEARALAALNHPNIAAIYGFENEHDSCALVLELVEGPTLQQVLAKGPLPLQDALRVARQLAEALEAAHEKGIAHRDLKPANIKITRNGTAKVLDFGLAKALAGESAAQNLSQAATDTGQGIILGTPAYMSPEQATGQGADKAADIWAFGCVLFEMLSARRAFAGDSTTEIIGSVLGREPNWAHLPADVPENVRRLLQRCLDKDPRRRMHHIADARVELDDALSPLPSTRLRNSTSRRRTLAWLAAAALLLFAGLGAYLLNFRRMEPPAGTRSAGTITERQLTSNPIEDPVVFAAISPDGKYVAYNDSSAVRIRLIDTGETRTLSVPADFCYR
jgi:eukaryotic-like serine/threonine-protein kinase